MNRHLSKYLFYYPITLLRGEWVAHHLQHYERMQWQSPETIQKWQLQQLNHLIHYAQNNITYYRDIYSIYGKDFKFAQLNEIRNTPFLKKTDLIEYANILSRKKGLFTSSKTTGGSTGQAVTLLKNADALARERAATWRAYRWAGIRIGDPQARFWGIPLQKKRRLLYSLADLAANRKRFSAFNINQDSLQEYHTALHHFKPAYLYGYVSMIHEFTTFLQQKQLRLPASVKSIITTSEILTNTIRQQIESCTGLKIYNEYGCGEVGSIAHECEVGSMHLMSDNLIVEIIDENDNPAQTGEIVITDLFNHAMPLIRYRLGDFATLAEKPCACGRGLPVIEKIHGRAYDMIVTPAGKRVHPESIMYVFEEFKETHGGIQQFQVTQITPAEFEINIIRTESYQARSAERQLAKRINEVLGDTFKYRFVYIEKIEREKSGKLRVIKSRLTHNS